LRAQKLLLLLLLFAKISDRVFRADPAFTANFDPIVVFLMLLSLGSPPTYTPAAPSVTITVAPVAAISAASSTAACAVPDFSASTIGMTTN
jgi:hypothetical protein